MCESTLELRRPFVATTLNGLRKLSIGVSCTENSQERPALTPLMTCRSQVFLHAQRSMQ